MNDEQPYLSVELVPGEAIPRVEIKDGRGTIAPFVDRARELVLSDKATFEANLEAVRVAVEAEVAPFVKTMTDLTVTDAETYAAALKHRARAVAFVKRIDALLDPLKKDFWTPYKRVGKLIDTLTAGLSSEREAIDRRAYRWNQDEKERIRKENEAAQKKADDERRAAEDAKRAVSQDLVGKGKTAAALEVLQTPVEVPPPVMQSAEAPKVEGTAAVENWQWEGTDLGALVQGIIQHTVPLEAVTWNGPVITKAAKQMKQALGWPGVRVWDAGTFRRTGGES